MVKENRQGFLSRLILRRRSGIFCIVCKENCTKWHRVSDALSLEKKPHRAFSLSEREQCSLFCCKHCGGNKKSVIVGDAKAK